MAGTVPINWCNLSSEEFDSLCQILKLLFGIGIPFLGIYYKKIIQEGGNPGEAGN